MSTPYDVLVIGGGAAGENVADIAVRGGLRASLIEHELVGGECSYWACMPSKALLRPGDALQALRRVPGFLGAEIEMDVDEALARRDALAANWDDSGQVDWLENAGVDLIRGHGRIAGDREVSVTDSTGETKIIEAREAVVVATGSAPSYPPIDGLEDVGVWGSRDATTAKAVPQRLLVLGGGVVGVEMAQAWKWLGADEVILLELDDHLLTHEEEFAGDELQSSLERMGVTVHTAATTRSMSRAEKDGPATVSVELSDGNTVEIETDEVLVATGRQANTADLGMRSETSTADRC
jgi:pyruvate/2-oxoglutarate dehydrogenase complex dihydrolipoamide dehydrogenase (E3) component